MRAASSLRRKRACASILGAVALISAPAIMMPASPLAAQISSGVDCTFNDGFTPPIGHTSGSQSDLVMSRLPVAVARQASDLDSIVTRLGEGADNGQYAGEAGRQAFDKWLELANLYLIAMHDYDDGIKAVAGEYQKEADEAKKNQFAEKVCEAALSAGGIVERMDGYLKGPMAAVYNGTSAAPPSSGTFNAAVAVAQKATDTKKQMIALKASVGTGQASTGGTAGSGNAQGLLKKGTPIGLTLPLGDISLPQFISRIIRALLGIVGALALVFFIWGGLKYMTAAGDDKKVAEGRNMLRAAIMGLAAIFLSYALLSLLIRALS